MFSRQKLYHFFVNRHIGISQRYHKVHDGVGGIKKILSWCYLAWLNLAYYILFCHFLGEKKETEIYEQKRLDISSSESSRNGKLSVEDYVELLKEYDVISFDIFDTLIFRPFSEPTDLFYLLGAELECMNFKEMRVAKEWECRQEKYKETESYEVTLTDIWKRIEQEAGICAEKGLMLEEELELSLCYANPFMKKVFLQLKQMGKRIVIVSDMYLSKELLNRLLHKNGFEGFDHLYVSCEYGKSKADGSLFDFVKSRFHANQSMIHVGDNEISDVKMAKKAGFAVLHYPSVNRMSLSYRPYDMSVMIGGAYRGVVNNHLYCGVGNGTSTYPYTMEYEYGFIYGGLFVLGYCGFIHEYCRMNDIDKVLFLSRDGDILKQVYDYLYPQEPTAYVYWSRKAATKLEASFDKLDYFRRFLFHKINQDYTIKEILDSMELSFLIDELGDWKNIWEEKHRKSFVELKAEDKLTDKNADALKQFLDAKWGQVLAAYSSQNRMAKDYYEAVLSGCKRAAAVDIGWAGSGAMVLRHLVSYEWNIPCEIIGIIAGTNTVYNAEPNASESFLQSGKLVAYLYSQSHNRDLQKKHDTNKDYNVFWELLLSSPTPQFKGFYPEGPSFGSYDANQEGIKEIQRGIIDFVKEYVAHFTDFPYMLRISGRDAYAPMLVAASHQEKYLKEMEKRFHLEINVN